MSEIKCPACWNDIPSESENCPCCGFLLKTPKAQMESSSYSFSEKSIDSSFSPYKDTYNNLTGRTIDKEKKNKRIIGVAVAVIVVILVIDIIGGNSKNKKDSAYDYPSSYTGYAGSSSTSYVTTGREGALNKAKSYLNSSAFSYTGLIEQLEYEGFSETEATYGADNCGANWKDQALKKAKSYLSSSAFSETGLQEQLEYEGFTIDEASYGVNNCGADWKQQASKKAASYLRSHSDWTRSELIDQLEYEGFTYDEASYGASQNGL